MNKLLAILICLPLLSFSYPPQDIEREFPTTAGKKLEMDLKTGGSIHVTGWNKNTISVKVLHVERAHPEPKIDFEELSSGLRITTRFSSHRGSSHSDLDFEIQLPNKYDLDLQSMGGEFRIKDVQGDIKGKTMGGELDLEGLKGRVDLLTMGGEITLRNSDVDGQVKTMGGKVLVDHVTGKVDATSQGGAVEQRSSRRSADEAPNSEVRISTMGGDINVDDAPLGADVHTMGGDIRVKSAADHVKAKTMGGTIDIEAVDGWVTATTMGGNVEVTMTGDPSQGRRDVTLESMGGDIVLNVPPALAMSVDITLAYTEDRENDYHIVSDFDLKQEQSKEWDDSNGSPRKYIYGTGTVGSGKNKITIKTINGDVHLKKK